MAATVIPTRFLAASTFIRRAETTGTTSYAAKAPSGTAESAALWTITKIVTAASGTVTTTSAVSVAWTNRASATYS